MINQDNKYIVWALTAGIVGLVIMGLWGRQRLPLASMLVLAAAAWFGWRLYRFVKK